MGVTGKPQVQGELRQAALVLHQALQGQAQAKAIQIAMKGQSHVPAEHPDEMKRGAMNFPGDVPEEDSLSDAAVEHDTGRLRPLSVRLGGARAHPRRLFSPRGVTFTEHGIQQPQGDLVRSQGIGWFRKEDLPQSLTQKKRARRKRAMRMRERAIGAGFALVPVDAHRFIEHLGRKMEGRAIIAARDGMTHPVGFQAIEKQGTVRIADRLGPPEVPYEDPPPRDGDAVREGGFLRTASRLLRPAANVRDAHHGTAVQRMKLQVVGH